MITNKNYVYKITTDENFNKIIDIHIKAILEDGKVDYKDIPQILLLLSDVIFKFKINSVQLPEVIKMVLELIFNKYNIIIDDNLRQLINNCINLLLLVPKLKNCCK